MIHKTLVGLTEPIVTWLDAIAEGREVSRSELIRDILDQHRMAGAKKEGGLITDQEIIDTLEHLKNRINDRAAELAMRRAKRGQK